MNYLETWLSSLLSRPTGTLVRPVRVTGIRDKHLGPRLEYAVIDLLVEPSAAFEVDMSALSNVTPESREFLEHAVFGVLDVIMLAEPLPIANVRIVFTDAKFDRVSSSKAAFRHAGRDAGRKLLGQRNSPVG
jgi:hypothetical protein